MNADGSDIVRLTSTPGHNFAPTWSPDGRSILFASSRAHPLASMILGADLYLMDADGSNVRRLTTIGGVGYSPNAGGKAAWRPTDPPDESPAASETPAEECDESTIRGDFDGNGRADTATVLRARCSVLAEPAAWAIQMDWNGPTAVWAVRECVEWCQALAAPDLDGDGRDELAIQIEAFSIHIFHVYTALPRETGPVALQVASPGDPDGGFEPGAAPTFSAGGDGFWTYNIRCDRRADGRVIVVTAAESLPHDSPDAVWHVHETVLRLARADPSNVPDPTTGEFEVVSVGAFTVPTDDPEQRPLFFDYADLCGAPLATGAPG